MNLTAQQTGKAIVLRWNFEAPTVSFQLTPVYENDNNNFITNEVIIQYPMTLYMNNSPSNASMVLTWVVNDIETTAANGNTWNNRTMTFNKNDRLKIKGAYSGRNAYNNTTLSLLMTNGSGYTVSSFTYSLAGKGGGSCYMTTAMVERFGYNDNGSELTAMRNLRDLYINQEGYNDLINEYYMISPIIIEGIDNSEDSDMYYTLIKDSVKRVESLMADNKIEEAHNEYLDTYYYLKNIFYTE